MTPIPSPVSSCLYSESIQSRLFGLYLRRADNAFSPSQWNQGCCCLCWGVPGSKACAYRGAEDTICWRRASCQTYMIPLIPMIHRRLLTEPFRCKIRVLCSDSSMRTWDVLLFGKDRWSPTWRPWSWVGAFLSLFSCLAWIRWSDLPKGEARRRTLHTWHTRHTQPHEFSTWKATARWALKMRLMKPPRQEKKVPRMIRDGYRHQSLRTVAAASGSLPKIALRSRWCHDHGKVRTSARICWFVQLQQQTRHLKPPLILFLFMFVTKASQ